MLLRIAEPHHLKCAMIATQPEVQTVLLDTAVRRAAPPACPLAAETPSTRVQCYLELSVQFGAGQPERGGDAATSATHNRHPCTGRRHAG